MFHRDNNTREVTYTFSFKKYQRCSDSIWEHWKPIISKEHTNIQHANYTLLCEKHENHMWLDPYFIDNLSLLQKGVKMEDKEDKDGKFTYMSEMYEDGIKWPEDVWSKRLCHGIRNHIIDERFHIEFTGKDGSDVIRDVNAKMFRFHGAPDLTITKKNLDHQCIIMEAKSTFYATSTSSSQSISYTLPGAEVSGMIENSIQNERYVLENGVPVVHKTGELLANMHIMLVRDIVNLLKEKRLTTSSCERCELVMHGLLLIRSEGALLCTMKMPVVDVVRHLSQFATAMAFSTTIADIPTLSITLESSLGGLTPDTVCSSITSLLNKFNKA